MLATSAGDTFPVFWSLLVIYLECMSHPHQYLLLELDIAIKKLPPTLLELQKEARAKLAAFEANDTIAEEDILGYIAEIGRKEYPHRHALVELHEQFGQQVELDLILEHLDADVVAMVKPMVEQGVLVDSLIKSDWFEKQLTPEQRYQVEDGVLLARYKMEQEDKGLVALHQSDFDALVQKWEAEAETIEAGINELSELATKDPRYTDEINGQVRAFRTGWSVVEPDPDKAAVMAQVQHWKAVFEDEASGT